jgi:hypothetical protein
MSMRSKFLGVLALSATAVFLVACGGGGGGGTATTTTTISGSAVKGPVSGSTVTVRNAATGAVLGTTTTGAGGLYSIDISFTGDVLIEVTGGTYTDEATGLATPLSTPLRVVLNANGGAVTGIATPLTTMAYTYALGGGSSVSASAFNTAATTLANQFQLTGVNLATTTPVVSGSLNGYGRVLSAISRYLQLNGATLQSLVGVTFNTTQWADFSAAFSTAYAAANPGSNISFSFDGSAFTVAGTGAGGGSGTCGVQAQGSVTTGGFTVPISLNYCVSGIAAGSCDSGNSSLSQALGGQQGLSGATNLTYTVSPTCAAGAVAIVLQ